VAECYPRVRYRLYTLDKKFEDIYLMEIRNGQDCQRKISKHLKPMTLELWAAAKKNLSASVAVPSAPFRVPTTYLECYVSHVFQLMIRVIMRRYRELCTNLLEFTLHTKKTTENLS
jgi:hypothetical protein